MQMVAGQVIVSREQKVGGASERTMTGSETEPVLVTEAKGRTVSVSLGRTISLGDFNFARVECGVQFADDGDDAIGCAKRIAQEVLDRESAAITNGDRVAVPLTFADDLSARRIKVTYGMTRSLKAYESARFDVTVDEPVADGVPFETALKAVQGITGRFIEAELKALRSAKPVGF
jgi:hypothetical protein